jgi:UDP-glucuronate 4-epimerase
MAVLVTGAAGFIGYHVARRLAEKGERVIGADNLNRFYDPQLKRRRLAELAGLPGFAFHHVDLADDNALGEALRGEPIRRVIHLAAQANVRHALKDPRAYVHSNVVGHLGVLEYCRSADVESLVYASSSSVYGIGNTVPFLEGSVTDRPSSLYAATKKSAEMMSAVYAELFGLKQIGLRFFSVYGPWGRPDMAYWLFTEAILKGETIRVFGDGKASRDFTYISDVVAGVLNASDAAGASSAPSHRVYNIGNSRPVALLDMIAILEAALGRKARLEFQPAQPGEVPVTFADISASQRDLGFEPRTPLEVGLTQFVAWFRCYHGLD